MFNVSTKSDYGFIVMLELAKHYRRGYVSLTQIAKEKRLSAGYLVQLIQPLVKAKLIVSKEGKGGGYALAKSPQNISVLEILDALEGPTMLVQCLKSDSKRCPGFEKCEVRKIWEVMAGDIRKMLKQETLAQLLKDI